MALSLIINLGGYVSMADKSLDIRWGNCSLESPTTSYREGLVGVYRKYLNDERAFKPEFEFYSDLTYHPLIQWSEE